MNKRALNKNANSRKNSFESGGFEV